MVAPSVGVVDLVRFPFTDLSQSKLRPAACLADAGRGDWVLCQITSNPCGDPTSQRLESTDFATDDLRVTSFARPGKLFTANTALIVRTIGFLTIEARERVITAVVDLLRPPL